MKQVFYVPERGDVVRLTFPSRDGHMQASHCHAVVFSPQAYNARVGLAILCPIVSDVKGYPFEVPLPRDLPVAGVVLTDQAVSLDWRALRAERTFVLPPGVVEQALGKLRALLV